MNLGKCSACWESYSSCTCSGVQEPKLVARGISSYTQLEALELLGEIHQHLKSLATADNKSGMVQSPNHNHSCDELVKRYGHDGLKLKHSSGDYANDAFDLNSYRVIPIIRDLDNEHFLTSPDEDTSYINQQGSGVFYTAPLKVNQNVNLLQISNKKLLIQANAIRSDAIIARASYLNSIVISIGGELFSFLVTTNPRSSFTPSHVDPDLMMLQFEDRTLIIDSTTKTITGNTPKFAKFLQDRNEQFKLHVKLEADISPMMGELRIGEGSARLIDNDNLIPEHFSYLSDIKVAGIVLDAYFS